MHPYLGRGGSKDHVIATGAAAPGCLRHFSAAIMSTVQPINPPDRKDARANQRFTLPEGNPDSVKSESEKKSLDFCRYPGGLIHPSDAGFLPPSASRREGCGWERTRLAGMVKDMDFGAIGARRPCLRGTIWPVRTAGLPAACL